MTYTDKRALFIAFIALSILGLFKAERQFEREDRINQEASVQW